MDERLIVVASAGVQGADLQLEGRALVRRNGLVEQPAFQRGQLAGGSRGHAAILSDATHVSHPAVTLDPAVL
jgi:hypothetical protein